MRVDEYTIQAEDFLKEANATCDIRLIGLMRNENWKEKELRNAYNVTLKTPRGEMNFTFWDSIYNTKIANMSYLEYAKEHFKCEYQYLTGSDKRVVTSELKQKKLDVEVTPYDVLSCLQKCDVGTFEDFCSEFGYDDSITTHNMYIAVIKEYKQLERIFTPEQMEWLREIN